MSFMGGGGECSSAGNPLSQFQKHVQGGSSLSQDHLVNRNPASGASQFRTTPNQSSAQDEAFHQAMAQQDPMLGAAGPPNLHLDPMSQGVPMRTQPSPSAWAGPAPLHPSPAAMEAAFKPPSAAGPEFSPQDFAKFQAMQSNGQQHLQQPSPASQSIHQPMMNNGMHGMGMMSSFPIRQMPMYRPGMHQHQPPEVVGKGKGKEVVELDEHEWEKQFEQITLEDQKAKEEEEQARAMEPELDKMDEKLAEHSETNYGDFESIWKGIQAENEAVSASGDFVLDDEWKTQDEMADWNTFEGLSGGSMLKNFQEPMMEEYLFEQDNLFREMGNPYEEGLKIMNEGGNLSLAALAFEAAVQKDPLHVDAWVHLGSAQAQNEKETAAIRAFERAVSLDPQNLAALMGLAVSYTNEGYDSTAYRTLERWLSVKYPQVVSPKDLSPIAEMGFTDRHELHNKVTDLFIKAAQLSPGGDTAHMDPDVQVGLGVLFYGAEEYDKAVDCFAAALASSEQGTVNESSQVHLLWNRLGATLANSGRSEEAINAYEKALSINPNFVRARYNLGVSCINIGCHAEAAGHLLSALSMHKSVEKEGREKAREILRDANGGGPVDEGEIDRMGMQNTSSTLYDTLRRVFTQMGRRDLADRVVPGMDPEGFRGEFDF